MKKNNKNTKSVKNNNKMYRQGDVLVVPVNEIPANLVKTKIVRLALGEATGHHHSIFDTNTTGYGETDTALVDYFEVEGNSNATLVHQEHDAITIPPGTYKSIRQVEYTPEALKNVAD